MPKHIVSYAVLCCVLSVIACAQCPVNETQAKAVLHRQGSWNGPGPTVPDVLKEIGIPLTKESLLAALSCQDPEIRSLAAGELTHQKVKEAIPELERLLDASGPLWKGQLAVDLAINPNTVVRAYRELEIREVLATQQGTGTFLTDKKPPVDELERRRRIGQLCGELLSRAGAEGITLPEIIEQLTELQNESERRI